MVVKYRQLDTNRAFSPAIFAAFSKLTKAIQKGSMPEIIDGLHYLNIIEPSQIYDSAFRITSILTEPWETDFIFDIRKDEFPNKNNDPILVLPILTNNFSECERVFFDFLSAVKTVDIDFFTEFKVNVTRLKLFNGKALKAATSASVFGAIYLHTPTGISAGSMLPYFAEHLVHEASHLQLDILLAFDKVILNDESEKYPAPLRVDPRPMLGIFHATFVLFRMLRLFERLLSVIPGDDMKRKFDDFKKQFEQGYETVSRYARFTEKGQMIKDSLIPFAK